MKSIMLALVIVMAGCATRTPVPMPPKQSDTVPLSTEGYGVDTAPNRDSTTWEGGL